MHEDSSVPLMPRDTSDLGLICLAETDFFGFKNPILDFPKETILTAPFNNMRTLNFKAQPTNVLFATVNQMFGGSFQPPTMLSKLCSTI